MPWRKLLSLHPADRLCLIEPGRSITYGNLLAEVEAKAQQLYPYTCIALQLDNSIDWVLWDLASQLQDVTLVPLPPFFTPQQIQHTLQTVGAEAVITAQGITPTGLTPQSLPAGTSKVTFTSGTTGTPKGVCLSTKAQWQVAQSLAEVLGPQFTGQHLTSLPLGVLLENVAGVYTNLLLGGTVVLASLTNFGQGYSGLHAQLHQHVATSLITVPEQLRLLINQTRSYGRLPHLKFIAVGGAKVSPELITQARSLGLPVYEGYGLSEMGSVVSLNTPQDDHPGSVGRLLPHVKAQLFNGEIAFIDPLYNGYVGEPKQPVFMSGDLGRITPQGEVSIDGRRKNLLITAWGRNVSPEWVESELLQQSEILQTIVFGDGEAQLSALVVSTRSRAEVAAALAHTNNRLPTYARLGRFMLVPPFTMAEGTLTGTGRPKRQEILNRYINKENNIYDLLPTA